MACPTLNDLADFARGVATPASQAEIKAHLATNCPSCQEEQRWLSQVAQLAAQDQSADYPEWIIKRVLAQFVPQTQTAVATLRQFFAQLVFDSFAPQQLAQTRSGGMGAGHATARQMLFQADGYDIDLRLEQNENGATDELLGQILPPQQSGTELAGITVHLLKDGVGIQQTVTNTRGLFKFSQIPAGEYELKLQTSAGEIIICGLTVAQNL